jgi:hypothetical protein
MGEALRTVRESCREKSAPLEQLNYAPSNFPPFTAAHRDASSCS